MARHHEYNINRYTRAGKNGKLIACTCGGISKVYHFSWSALMCPRCKEGIEKKDWIVVNRG